MPATRTQLLGWAPSGDDSEEVELPEYLQGTYTVPAFDCSGNSIGTTKSTLAFNRSFSPASTASSLSPEPSSSSDRFYNKRDDPSWVARPRNPFIIFRCEYSKEHAGGKDGNRANRAAGFHGEKTLSKKAAEAWHQLSPEAKNHFKALADQEREEHARRNPNYRYRPRKRPVGEKHKPIRCSSGSAFGRARRRGKFTTVVNGEENLIRRPSQQIHSPSIISPTPEIDLRIKTAQQRPSSVPKPSNLPEQHPASRKSIDSQRLYMKRSKSLAERPTTPPSYSLPQSMPPDVNWSSFPPLSNSSLVDGGFSSDAASQQIPEFTLGTYDPNFYVLSPEAVSSESPHTNQSRHHDEFPVHYVSPLAAVASSLAGWNGEPASVSEPSSALRGSLSSFGAAVSPEEQFPSVQVPKTDEAPPLYFDYFPADGAYGTNSIASIMAAQQSITSEQPPIDVNAAKFYDDLERLQALHEYEIGLMEQLGVDPSYLGYRAANEVTASQTMLDLDIGNCYPAF